MGSVKTAVLFLVLVLGLPQYAAGPSLTVSDSSGSARGEEGSAPEPWSVDDPSGDVEVAPNRAAPASPLTAHLDLVQVRLGNETEDSIELAIQVDALRRSPPTCACELEYASIYNFTFAVGAANFAMRIFAGVYAEPAADSAFTVTDANALFEVCAGIHCNERTVPVEIFDAEDEFRVRIPTKGLAGDGGEGQAPPPAGFPRALYAGDVLEDIHLQASCACGPTVEASDSAPDGDAPPYKIGIGASSASFSVTFPFEGLPAPVGIGDVTEIPFTIIDQAGSTGQIWLDYSVTTASGEAAGIFASGSRISAPATESDRRLSATVSVAPEVSDGTQAYLVVRATDLDSPEAFVVVQQEILPTTLLDTQRNVLYLHQVPSAHQSGSALEPLDAARCRHTIAGASGCGLGVFTTSRDWSNGQPEGTIRGSGSYDGAGSHQVLTAFQAMPVPSRLWLDPEGEIEISLALRTLMGTGSVRLTASFGYFHAWQNAADLLVVSREIEPSAETTDVIIRGPPAFAPDTGEDGVVEIPPFSQLRLVVTLDGQPPSLGSTSAATGGLELLPVESFVRLPIILDHAIIADDPEPPIVPLDTVRFEDSRGDVVWPTTLDPGAEQNRYDVTGVELVPEAEGLTRIELGLVDATRFGVPVGYDGVFYAAGLRIGGRSYMVGLHKTHTEQSAFCAADTMVFTASASDPADAAGQTVSAKGSISGGDTGNEGAIVFSAPHSCWDLDPSFNITLEAVGAGVFFIRRPAPAVPALTGIESVDSLSEPTSQILAWAGDLVEDPGEPLETDSKAPWYNAPFGLQNFWDIFGVLFALLGALLAFALLQRRRNIVRRYIRQIDLEVVAHDGDPEGLETALQELEGRFRMDAIRGRLTDGQFLVLHRHLNEVRSGRRLESIVEAFADLPHRLFERLKELLVDGRMSPGDYREFARALDDVPHLSPEFKADLRKRLERWVTLDLEGSGSVGQ